MADEAGSSGVREITGLVGLISNVPGQAYGPLVVAQTSLPLPYQTYGTMGAAASPQGATE